MTHPTILRAQEDDLVIRVGKGGAKKPITASQRDQIVATLKAAMILHGIRSPSTFLKFAAIARAELEAEESARCAAALGGHRLTAAPIRSANIAPVHSGRGE